MRRTLIFSRTPRIRPLTPLETFGAANRAGCASVLATASKWRRSSSSCRDLDPTVVDDTDTHGPNSGGGLWLGRARGGTGGNRRETTSAAQQSEDGGPGGAAEESDADATSDADRMGEDQRDSSRYPTPPSRIRARGRGQFGVMNALENKQPAGERRRQPVDQTGYVPGITAQLL